MQTIVLVVWPTSYSMHIVNEANKPCLNVNTCQCSNTIQTYRAQWLSTGDRGFASSRLTAVVTLSKILYPLISTVSTQEGRTESYQHD